MTLDLRFFPDTTKKYLHLPDHIKSRIEDKVDSITHIWFMNGMQTHSRQMLVKFLGLEKTHNQYALKLGDIVSRDISTIDKLVHC